MLTDLNFPPNAVDNQAFMMLDYARDNSYSFPNDSNLILQENLFNRSPPVNLTGTDSFIYNSLVTNDLSVTNDHSSSCDFQTDFDISTNVSNYFPSTSTTYDDDLEGQPLDTNKFLNEQYLVKTDKTPRDSEEDFNNIESSAIEKK